MNKIKKSALSLIVAGGLMIGGGMYLESNVKAKNNEIYESLSDYYALQKEFIRIRNFSPQKLYDAFQNKEFVDNYRNLLQRQSEYNSNPSIQKSLEESNTEDFNEKLPIILSVLGLFPLFFGGMRWAFDKKENSKEKNF